MSGRFTMDGVDKEFVDNAAEMKYLEIQLHSLQKTIKEDTVDRVVRCKQAVADATLSRDSMAEIVHNRLENNLDLFIERAERLVADLRRAKQYSQPNPRKQENEKKIIELNERLAELNAWFANCLEPSTKKAKASSTFVQ